MCGQSATASLGRELTPDPEEGLMTNIIRRTVVGLAVVVAVIVGGTAPAWAVTTSASITCHKNADSSFPLGPHIHTAGSGIQYPRNTQIDVIWQVFREGTYIGGGSTRIYTSSTGSWSRPSSMSPASTSYNRYHIEMWVYQVSTDKLIGYDWDECYMVPPAERTQTSAASALVGAQHR
jgi:hypothetical protein